MIDNNNDITTIYNNIIYRLKELEISNDINVFNNYVDNENLTTDVKNRLKERYRKKYNCKIYTISTIIIVLTIIIAVIVLGIYSIYS